jgi:hypothetical protein
MTKYRSATTGLASVQAEVASTVRWRIFGIIFVLVVINLIDRVTIAIAMGGRVPPSRAWSS